MKPSKVETNKVDRPKPDKAKIKAAKSVKELAEQVEILAEQVAQLQAR